MSTHADRPEVVGLALLLLERVACRAGPQGVRALAANHPALCKVAAAAVLRHRGDAGVVEQGRRALLLLMPDTDAGVEVAAEADVAERSGPS